jgi:hypothetical protein
MKRFVFAAIACGLFGLVGSADASLITYTQTTTASGTLGANSFTDAAITMVATADTASVTGGSGFFSVNNDTLKVTVAGIGTATFTGSTDSFVNQGFAPPAAGEGMLGVSILDTLSNAFAAYDLKTAIGPITGASFIRPALSYATDLGLFNLSSAGDATFTASLGTAVPEPSTLAVSGGVVMLLSMAHLFRRRRAAV